MKRVFSIQQFYTIQPNERLIDTRLEEVISLYRDSVRDAVLGIFRAMLPDEQYDPSDDPRQEEAVSYLGELLNSPYAAEGIQQAFDLLLAQNVEVMSKLSIPLLVAEEDEQTNEV